MNSTKMETSSLRKRFTDLQDLDMEMIKGIPWAEEMWNTLFAGLTKTFLNWAQVAMKMSDKESDLLSWVQVFTEIYEDTCCELVCDIEYLKSNVISNIEHLLEKVDNHCKSLKISMPTFDIDNSSLYMVQSQLKKRVEELEHSIETRKTDLNKLRLKQLELCKCLGREPRVVNDNPLPSLEDMSNLQSHIEKLEQKKFERLEKFYVWKEEISNIISELNIAPSTEFERDVLSCDDSKFLVTDENMKELEGFHASLKRQLVDVKEEIGHLRGEVDQYWDLLEVSLQERQEFRQKNTGNSVEVLEALRFEVKRCLELKKANIKVFVDKLRNELCTMWELCHCSDSVKDQFSYFNSDCYTEDLLELHEIELKKWKVYYEENKEILLLLKKHAKLWSKWLELEACANGPDRFNNRGGKLLQEEKERKSLAKQIPKVEETLRDLAHRYEKHHRMEFRTFGKTIEDYLYDVHAERENAKKEKLSARKMQRDHTTHTILTPAKSAMCLFPGGTSTMNTPSLMPVTPKRKIFDNVATTDPRKKPKTSSRLVVTEPKKPRGFKGATPKITLSTINHSKRLSIERKKRIEKIRRRSALKQKNNASFREDTETEYDDFENEVSNRIDCRSTLNPNLLTVPTITVSSAPKTPSRTPSKTPRQGAHRNRAETARNAMLSTAKTNLEMHF